VHRTTVYRRMQRFGIRVPFVRRADRSPNVTGTLQSSESRV
jgi:hypothetical protein